MHRLAGRTRPQKLGYQVGDSLVGIAVQTVFEFLLSLLANRLQERGWALFRVFVESDKIIGVTTFSEILQSCFQLRRHALHRDPCGIVMAAATPRSAGCSNSTLLSYIKRGQRADLEQKAPLSSRTWPGAGNSQRDSTSSDTTGSLSAAGAGVRLQKAPIA